MRNELTHQQAQQALSAQVDGLLSTETLPALERHLAGCPSCRNERAELLALEASVRKACREHARVVKAAVIDPERILVRGKLLKQANRERRVLWAAAVLVVFLLVWLAGVGLQQAWPPEQLLRMDKTRPAVLPTLAAYEPSPTPTEEPLAGRWGWQPALAEDHTLETPRSKFP